MWIKMSFRFGGIGNDRVGGIGFILVGTSRNRSRYRITLVIWNNFCIRVDRIERGGNINKIVCTNRSYRQARADKPSAPGFWIAMKLAIIYLPGP